MEKKTYSAEKVTKLSKELFKDTIKKLTRVVSDREIAKNIGGFVSGSVWNPKNIRRPLEFQKMSADEVAAAITRRMPLAADCQFVRCDAAYAAYPRVVFDNFMKSAAIDQETYVPETFDCDDFSITFAAKARSWHAKIRWTANAEHQLISGAPDAAAAAAAASDGAEHAIGGCPIGVCHGTLSENDGEHAFNFWVAPDGSIVFIEPQTGEEITLGRGAVINFVYI